MFILNIVHFPIILAGIIGLAAAAVYGFRIMREDKNLPLPPEPPPYKTLFATPHEEADLQKYMLNFKNREKIKDDYALVYEGVYGENWRDIVDLSSDCGAEVFTWGIRRDLFWTQFLVYASYGVLPRAFMSGLGYNLHKDRRAIDMCKKYAPFIQYRMSLMSDGRAQLWIKLNPDGERQLVLTRALRPGDKFLKIEDADKGLQPERRFNIPL